MAAELLTPGTTAPIFTAKDQDGNTINLSDYKGKKVVLYFYPKDNTPGCTKQACNLRDNIDPLVQKGFQVLGVSVDDEKSHRKFIQKFDLNFPLLADTEQDIVNKYHVWGEKSMYGRTYMGTFRVTYIINEQGVIEHVIDKVKVDNHAEQILGLYA
jgi:peroxiredoxin Q/BCP